MNTAPYRERRAALAERLKLAGGGVALVATAPERTRSGDSEHPYRHDSYFHYLTGFDEPHAALVLRADGHSLLFCRPRDAGREIWDGFRLGPQAASQTLGVDEALPIDTLDMQMPGLLREHDAVWTLFDSSAGLAGRIAGWLSAARAAAVLGERTPASHRNLGLLLDEMRLVKSAGELATMRRAAAISAGAHVRAMRFCAEHLHDAPGSSLREYEIEAELLHEFRRHGAQSPAYTSIVAAGSNACVLHYTAGDAQLRAGELCLIDAGCELDGYASDITRTFPADGRFSPSQRKLYDVVEAALAAAVAATHPGARQRDAHHAAVRVLSQGMLDTGLLSRDRHGNVDDVIGSTAYRQFYMHGTGHWLGRDVHDVGEYLSLDEEAFEQPDSTGKRVVKKPSRLLRAGMVVTLEPGLYVRPAEGVPERFWNIGIRIEDDAVITDTGCELISRGAPVKADEIEAWMASSP